jgi:signal transduction histidine kinase
MHLDTYTALTLLMYAMVVLPLAVFIGKPVGPRRLPMKLYVLGGVLIAIGIALWSQRGIRTDWLTFGTANTFFVFGIFLSAISLRAELFFPWPGKRWLAAPVLFVAGLQLLGSLEVPRGRELLVKSSVWLCLVVMAYSCGVALRRRWNRNVVILFAVFAATAANFSFDLFHVFHGVDRMSVYPYYILWYMPPLILIAACVANIGFLGLVLENDHIADMAKVTSLAEEESRSRMAEVLAKMDRSSNLNVISSSLGLQLSQPLAAIKLNAQLLQKRMARKGVSSGELADGLDQVIEQVRACAGIVDQVRQFIKQPDLKVVMVDLQLVVREVWDLLRQEAQQKGVQVDFPPELPGMYGALDRLRTSQVLMNLLRSGSEGLQLGAAGSIRLRFRRANDGVEVVILVPWPPSGGDTDSALTVRLLAHAVVFQSRLLSARSTLAEFGASIGLREVERQHRELVLHFLGSKPPVGESKMERA